METFDERDRELLDGKSFATVATIDLDGGPHTSVVWVDRDGNTVIFSTTSRRRKARNLARDPRISLTVFDPSDPYRTVDIRGTAELIDDPGKILPKTLSHKYQGAEPPPEPESVRRLIVRVTPMRITHWGN